MPSLAEEWLSQHETPQDTGNLSLADKWLRSNDPEYARYAAEYDEGVSISDPLKGLAAGFVEGLSGIAELGSEDAGEWMKEQADSIVESISPRAKEAFSKPLYTEDDDGLHLGEGFSDPATWLMKVAHTGGIFGSMFATGGPLSGGARIALGAGSKALNASAKAIAAEKKIPFEVALKIAEKNAKGRGMAAGGVGYGASEAAIVGGISERETRNAILTMPEDILVRSQHYSKAYWEDFSDVEDDAERRQLAREKVAEEGGVAARNETAAWTFLFGAASGVVIDDVIRASGLLPKNRMGRAGVVGVTEGGTESIQGGSEKYVSNVTLAEYGGADIAPMEGVKAAALEEGTLGGVVGTTLGITSSTPAEDVSVEDLLKEGKKIYQSRLQDTIDKEAADVNVEDILGDGYEIPTTPYVEDDFAGTSDESLRGRIQAFKAIHDLLADGETDTADALDARSQEISDELYSRAEDTLREAILNARSDPETNELDVPMPPELSGKKRTPRKESVEEWWNRTLDSLEEEQRERARSGDSELTGDFSAGETRGQTTDTTPGGDQLGEEFVSDVFLSEQDRQAAAEKKRTESGGILGEGTEEGRTVRRRTGDGDQVGEEFVSPTHLKARSEEQGSGGILAGRTSEEAGRTARRSTSPSISVAMDELGRVRSQPAAEERSKQDDTKRREAKKQAFRQTKYTEAIEPRITELKKQRAVTPVSERKEIDSRIKDLRNMHGEESQAIWDSLPEYTEKPDISLSQVDQSTPQPTKASQPSVGQPTKASQPAPKKAELEKSFVVDSEGNEVDVTPEQITQLSDDRFSVSSDVAGVSGTYHQDNEMYDAPVLVSDNYSVVDQSTTSDSSVPADSSVPTTTPAPAGTPVSDSSAPTTTSEGAETAGTTTVIEERDKTTTITQTPDATVEEIVTPEKKVTITTPVSHRVTEGESVDLGGTEAIIEETPTGEADEQVEIRSEEKGGSGQADEQASGVRESDGQDIPITSEESRFVSEIRKILERKITPKSIQPFKALLRDLVDSFGSGYAANEMEHGVLTYLTIHSDRGSKGEINVRGLVKVLRDAVGAKVALSSIRAGADLDAAMSNVKAFLALYNIKVPKSKFARDLFGTGGVEAETTFGAKGHARARAMEKRGGKPAYLLASTDIGATGRFQEILASYKSNTGEGISSDIDESTSEIDFFEETNVDYDTQDAELGAYGYEETGGGEGEAVIAGEARQESQGLAEMSAETVFSNDEMVSGDEGISTGSVQDRGAYGLSTLESGSSSRKEFLSSGIEDDMPILEHIAEMAKDGSQIEDALALYKEARNGFLSGLDPELFENKGHRGNAKKAYDKAARDMGIPVPSGDEVNATMFGVEVDEVFDADTSVDRFKNPSIPSVQKLLDGSTSFYDEADENIQKGREPLGPSASRMIGQLIDKLIETGRIPEYAINGISAILVKRSEAVSMSYAVKQKFISISSRVINDLLVPPSKSSKTVEGVMDGLAHEIWHSIDIAGTGESVAAEIRHFDHQAEGSAAAKSHSAFFDLFMYHEESSLGRYFTYPSLALNRFSEAEASAEYFAQMGALFTTRPEFFMREFGQDLFDLFDGIVNAGNIVDGRNILLGESNGKTKRIKKESVSIRSVRDRSFAGAHRPNSRRGEADGGATQKDGEDASGVQESQVVDQSTAEERFLSKIGAPSESTTFAARVKEALSGWSDKLRQGVFDRVHSFRRNAQEVAESLDTEIDYTHWMRARMTTSAREKVLSLIKYGRMVVDKFGNVVLDESRIKTDSDNNITETDGLASILNPLGDKADTFLNWMVALRAERLAREGITLPFTKEEIAAGLKLNSGNEAEFNDALKKFQSLHNSVVDVAVELGLVDQKEADIWRDDAYIPFYRHLEGESSVAGEHRGPSSLGSLTKQDAYKKMKGSLKNIGDPLENILLNWNHLLHASLNNQAASGAISDALKLNMGEVLHDPDGLFGEKLSNPKFRGGKGTVYVRHNGHKVWVRIDDQLTLRSLTAMEWTGMGGLGMKVGRGAKRLLTTSVTLSPAFRIRNLMRDSLHVLAISDLEFRKMGLNPNSPGWHGTKEDTLHYARVLSSGGMFRFGHQLGADPEAAKILMKSGVDSSNIIDSEEKATALAKRYAKQGVGWWQDVGSRWENVNRSALYDRVYETSGGDALQAAFAARDLLAFDASGEWQMVRYLSQLVPFMNARLQGIDRLGRAATDPKQRAKLLMVSGTYALVSALLYLSIRDDDDYKELEEWKRDTYNIVKVGDTLVYWPRPFELGLAGVFAERAIEMSLDGFDESSRKLFAARMFHALEETLSINPIPQAVKPVSEVIANYDFFRDAPIEGLGMGKLSPEAKRKAWTSHLGVGSSAIIRGVTFDQVELSPVQADHLIKGYLGWVGSMAMQITDGMINTFGDNQPPSKSWDEFPVVKGFFQQGDGQYSKYRTLFYEMRNEANEAYSTLKEYREIGELEKAAELYADKKDKLRLRKSINRAAKKITKWKKSIKLIRANARLSADEKKVRIERIQQSINRLSRTVVERYQ